MPELVVGRGLLAEAQILGHGPAEQEGALGYQPQLRPEVLLGEVPDVDAVEQDLAAGDVVETRHEVDSVVLPEPVLPTTAVVRPGANASVTCSSTGSCAPG